MASGSHVADVPDDIAEEADAAAQDSKKGILMVYQWYILTCLLTNTTFRPLISPTTLGNLHEDLDLHPPNVNKSFDTQNSCCHSVPPTSFAEPFGDSQDREHLRQARAVEARWRWESLLEDNPAPEPTKPSTAQSSRPQLAEEQVAVETYRKCGF